MKSSMQKLVSESIESMETPDIIPPGFKTLMDWASEMPELSEFRPNTARTKLGPILERLVKDKKVVRQKFYVRRGQKLISVDHYRAI